MDEFLLADEYKDLVIAEGEKGVLKRGRKNYATLFPSPSTIGCSFDSALCAEIGKAIGDECLSDGVDLLFAADPNVKDSADHSLYSSDPLLAGRLAAAVVAGVKERGVKCVLRNFVTPRKDVSERELTERYLWAFKVALSRSFPDAVSVAKSRINGVPISESKLIKSVLKEDFGFSGAVVAEPYSVADRALALSAGVDLDFTLDLDAEDSVKHALEKGVITEKDIVNSAERANALFPRKNKIIPSDMEANESLAERAARESVVLLKNDGVLPLGKEVTAAIYGEEKTQAGDLVKPFAEEKFFFAFCKKRRATLVSRKKDVPFVNCDVAIIWAGGAEENEIAKAFKRAGKKTIGLINDSSYIRVKEKYFDALLYTGLYGGLGGAALTDILLGVSPSGKLAEPLYRHSSVLYPFGHGLSYTRFEYSSMKLSENLYREGGEVRISVDVENVGDIEGKEIVELYVTPPKTRIEKPEMRLVGFAKLSLAPKEKKTVAFTINDDSLSYYDVDLRRWNIETGNYKIRIAASSEDVRAEKTLQVFSKDNLVGKNYADEKKAVAERVDALTTFGELKGISRDAYAIASKKAAAYIGKNTDEKPICVLKSYEKGTVARIIDEANE